MPPPRLGVKPRDQISASNIPKVFLKYIKGATSLVHPTLGGHTNLGFQVLMKRKRQPECRVGRKVHAEVARALRFLASRLTDADCEMLTRNLRKVQAMGPTSP